MKLAQLFGIFGVLVAAFAVSSLPAAAQSENGVAIAQSPDELYQACHGPSADATLNCARQKCRSEGGTNCLRVRWCYPAGFSGAMTYLENRQLTQTTFACGAPTETALLRMLAGLCASLEAATECRLMVLWSPDGTENARQDLLGKNTAP